MIDKKKTNWKLSIIQSAIIIAFLFLFLWPVTIRGQSMEPTFFTKDRVFICRLYDLFGKLDYNDIVLCKVVENGNNYTILKRIIALPGDKIKITAGKVYINNKLYNENYVLYDASFNLEETVIKKDEYFLMGDNRKISLDSRQLGCIKKNHIVSKVIIRFYPFDKLQVFWYIFLVYLQI